MRRVHTAAEVCRPEVTVLTRSWDPMWHQAFCPLGWVLFVVRFCSLHYSVLMLAEGVCCLLAGPTPHV